MVHLDLDAKVSQKQQQQKRAHDSRARTRHFAVGDFVYACGYGGGRPHWIPAQIVQRTGPVSFKVKLDGGITCRRHQDQLHRRFDPATEATSTDADTVLTGTEPLVPTHADPPEHS